MNTENRDFVIERLERQLKEKETELDDIKTNLRDSILREIRSDLKNDMDFHNRIAQLERRVQALSSNLNGVMDELLDQKSMIKSLGELSASRERRIEKPLTESVPAKEVNEVPDPKLYSPGAKPVKTDALAGAMEPVPKKVSPPPIRSVPLEEVPTARPANSRVSIRSDEKGPVPVRNNSHSSNINFNIREVPSVKKPEISEPEHRSEYIIAETDDERKLRLERSSGRKADHCNYIVAEEGKSSCREPVTEYETVEAREGEDAVVVTTRRK